MMGHGVRGQEGLTGSDPGIDRPPRGVMPRYIWIEYRIDEIVAAIKRFTDMRHPIPIEWVEEYNGLIEEVAKREESKNEPIDKVVIPHIEPYINPYDPFEYKEPTIYTRERRTNDLLINYTDNTSGK